MTAFWNASKIDVGWYAIPDVTLVDAAILDVELRELCCLWRCATGFLWQNVRRALWFKATPSLGRACLRSLHYHSENTQSKLVRVVVAACSIRRPSDIEREVVRVLVGELFGSGCRSAVSTRQLWVPSGLAAYTVRWSRVRTSVVHRLFHFWRLLLVLWDDAEFVCICSVLLQRLKPDLSPFGMMIRPSASAGRCKWLRPFRR